jgi:hypothetical protein
MSVNVSTNLIASNNVGFTPPVSAVSILVGVVVVVLLCVGAAVAFNSYQLHESPWWSDRAKANNAFWDWLDTFRSSPSFGQYGSLKEVPSGLQLSAPVPVIPPPVEQIASPSPPPVAWCFVGEDLTGRYCVKVPSAESCDRTRVFNSQQDCELNNGNAMPAGVVSPHDGRKMAPLSSGLLTP